MNHQVKPFTTGQRPPGYGTGRCNGLDDYDWPDTSIKDDTPLLGDLPVQAAGVERSKAINGTGCDCEN